MTVNSRIVARFGLLSIQVDRVRAGHHLAEEALTRHDKAVDTWYADNLRRDPADAEFIAYLHSQQKDDAVNGYPHVLRSSLFTTGYGMFEFFMTSLCRELEKHVAGPVLTDLRGEGIQRARLYLASVAQILFPETAEWQRLILYGKLRNAIVHAQGDLTSNRHLGAIKQLQAKEGTFALAPDESAVTLSRDFTPRFLDTVDAFGLQLNQSLESYIIVT